MNHTPAPGAAPLITMLRTQTALELRMLVRNGEQVLLTVVIPTVLLLLLHTVDFGDLGDLDVLVPGILALAVMSTAFTGLAIATGFERRYGVLKRLGTSPLPRGALLVAKGSAVLVIEVLQVALLGTVAVALGWRPEAGAPASLLLLTLGTGAFAALGLLMAGTLKAEVTLAAANLVYLLLLLGGGVIVPLDRLPDGVASAIALLPSAALGEGLRTVLAGGALPWASLLVLAAWAAGAGALAARTFRWE